MQSIIFVKKLGKSATERAKGTVRNTPSGIGRGRGRGFHHKPGYKHDKRHIKSDIPKSATKRSRDDDDVF